MPPFSFRNLQLSLPLLLSARGFVVTNVICLKYEWHNHYASVLQWHYLWNRNLENTTIQGFQLYFVSKDSILTPKIATFGQVGFLWWRWPGAPGGAYRRLGQAMSMLEHTRWLWSGAGRTFASTLRWVLIKLFTRGHHTKKLAKGPPPCFRAS